MAQNIETIQKKSIHILITLKIICGKSKKGNANWENACICITKKYSLIDNEKENNKNPTEKLHWTWTDKTSLKSIKGAQPHSEEKNLN
jgi:hypothetical protein